jgi:hypothetical protein
MVGVVGLIGVRPGIVGVILGGVVPEGRVTVVGRVTFGGVVPEGRPGVVVGRVTFGGVVPDGRFTVTGGRVTLGGVVLFVGAAVLGFGVGIDGFVVRLAGFGAAGAGLAGPRDLGGMFGIKLPLSLGSSAGLTEFVSEAGQGSENFHVRTLRFLKMWFINRRVPAVPQRGNV